MTTKRKMWTAVIVGLIISVAGLGGVKALQIGTMIKAGKSFAPPPEAVTTPQAEAVVAALRATIAKKPIRAPFDGRLGIRQVELGQVLSPGTPLVSLQSIDPIYAEFYLPQQTLSDLHRGMPTRLSTDAFPGKDWQGEISTVNPEVDLATRNVRVRATFANPGALLLPRMFANVEVLSPHKRPVVIIP